MSIRLPRLATVYAALPTLVCVLALALTPAAASAATANGDTLANDGNYAAAVAAFAAARAKAPKDAALTARLAIANQYLGDYKQAVEWAQKAVALAPEKPDYQLLLGNAYSDYVNDVSMFRKLGIAHKIRDAYQKAVALAPNDANARLSLAMFYLMAPGIAGGSDSDAEVQLQALAKLNPATADIARGQKALQTKQTQDAEHWFRAAASAAKDSSGEVALGMFLAAQHQAKAALATFDRAIATYPHEPAAYYQIGKLAAHGDADPQAGIKALKAYLGMPIDWRHGDAAYCWAHYRLGQIYTRLHNSADAAHAYQTALQLNPAFKQASEALHKLAAG